MAMEEEAQLPGASARWGSRAILNALSDVVAGFEANPGDPAAFLTQMREVLRGAQEDMATLVADARMLEIAQRIMGASCEVSGGEPVEVAADIRYFACRLLDQHLNSREETSGRKDVGTFLNLYTSMVSVAKGYQRCGALAKAIQVVEKTGTCVAQMLPAIGPDETAVRERVLTLQCEILYHKIEILSALDDVPAFKDRAKLAVQESRALVEKNNLPASLSSEFGILCYNIGVLRIKSESAQGAGENEVRSSSTEESLFWSEEAAKFFTGSSQKVHHAASKSLSAKARMMLNDLENAHRDLQVANGLNPTTKSLMLELQCLTCMNQHDKAAAFIASKITHENWTSLSARGDAAEAKTLACKTWILFASHLVEANRADAANDTFARIIEVVKSDGDAQHYEESHMHWIAALAQSGIRDLGLCSAQIEALSRRHAETPCSSLTQKRVVSICTMVIKECDASGSNKKAIEWRQKIMPWLSEHDSAAIVKQIVRMAVHIGAMDIAEQYMLKCYSGGKEDLILKVQVMFKAAKPGDGTEVKAEALLEALMQPGSQSTPRDTVEVLDSVFTQARAAGYTAIAKRCLAGFVDKVMAVSPGEIKDVQVHQLFMNMMMVLTHFDENGDAFDLVDGVSEDEVIGTLSLAGQYIEKNGVKAFIKGGSNPEHTLVLLADISWNMGSRLAKKISPDAGLDYAKAAKMYEMAATFSLLKMGICAEKEDASQACLSLFLSASCTALHVRCSEQGTLADDFMLRNALDLISKIRRTRKEHSLEVSNVAAVENEAKLEFEIACRLKKDAATLHAISSTYIREIVPSLPDDQIRLKCLSQMLSTCKVAEAPYSVTSELCDAAMLLFPAGGDRTRSIVELMADVQMLRIIRGHAEREGKLADYESLLSIAREHPADFPQIFLREAAIFSFNTGDNHMHWERAKQAEEWVGMSVKLSNAGTMTKEEDKAVMKSAYATCLEALRLAQAGRGTRN